MADVFASTMNGDFLFSVGQQRGGLLDDESADSFMPLLILVVIRANPPNLISNLEYIQRFRSPQRRSSESEYYLSSLAGAITFIERMDHTTLSRVTQTQLDANMQREAAKMEAEAAEKSESTDDVESERRLEAERGRTTVSAGVVRPRAG